MNFFQKYLKHKSVEDYNNCVLMRNATEYGIKDSVSQFEKDITKEIKSKNTKIFWKYVNAKLKRKTGISTLRKSNGEVTNDDYEKSEVLNEFLSSVYVNEDNTNMPTFCERTNGIDHLADVDLSEELILNKLLKLVISKSMGPGNLHPRFLKEITKEICFPLYIIFNKSLTTGEVPSDWNLANVTAVYKKAIKLMWAITAQLV